MSYPHVVGPPCAQRSLMEGIENLDKVLRLTLGPTSNRVGVASTSGNYSVELLDDAITLSHRILELPDPFEDMGSQILRKALDELSGRTRDGAASCSVLTHAILQRANPLLAAGHHPGVIIEGLRAGLNWVVSDLNRHVWPIDTIEEIEAVILTATSDVQLASIISEILDTIGPEGSLIVEETRHAGIAHEYVQGARWSGGQISPSLMIDTEAQIRARSPFILVSAAPLTTSKQIIPLLEVVAGTSSRSLMLIAPEYSDEVIGLLVANRQQNIVTSIIAVKTPQSIHYGSQILEDISILVRGRLFRKEESQALQSITIDDLGRATRVWASRSAFGIIGGIGDREKIGLRVRAIRSQARSEGDTVKSSKLSERAGNLTGLSALVRVETPARDRRSRSTRAVEKAAAIARQAIRHGVVSGGGVALARCASRLNDQFVNSPYELGAKVLAHALTEPMKVIVENAGLQSGPILNRAQTQSNSRAYNVITGMWVDCSESGLIDSWSVVRTSLEVAVSTATMVLSTDVLVRTRKSPIAGNS